MDNQGMNYNQAREGIANIRVTIRSVNEEIKQSKDLSFKRTSLP
jgi:hypothetical protein